MSFSPRPVLKSAILGLSLMTMTCSSNDEPASSGPAGSAGIGSDGGAGDSGFGGSGNGGTESGGTGGSNAGTGGSSGKENTVCQPNAIESCDCSQGVGSRRCAPDGSGWSSCDCETYGAEFAVSPTGDDSASGSPNAPFATLTRAKKAVADLVAKGIPDGGVVVWIHEGVYELTETLSFGASESGTKNAKVVWRGIPGQAARIIGGKRLDPKSFSSIPANSPILSRLDPDARDHVLQFDLASVGITDFGEFERRGFCRAASRSAVELFVNGNRLPLARWPDANQNTLSENPETGDSLEIYGNLTPNVAGHYNKVGTQDGVSHFQRQELVGGLQYHLYRHTWDHQGSSHTAWFLTTHSSGYPGNQNPWWYRYSFELGPMKTAAGATGIVSTVAPDVINHGFASVKEALSDTTWRYEGDRPSRWSDVADLRFHGFWKYAWADCHVKATSIDTASRTVTLGDSTGYGIAEGQPWYAYNIPEELTQPGEWWLDRKTGIVYLWPPSDFNSSDVVISTLPDPIVRVSDSGSWIELRDLTIEAGRSELVRVDGGHDVSLVGLTLRHAGTNGIVLDGANHLVDHCHLLQLGSGGARVSGGDRRSLQGGGSVIEHSHFEKFGQWEWTYRPAVYLDGVGHVVRNNGMHDAPHTAVLFNGNEHLIELNEIWDVCEFSSDAGAIYTGRDWGFRGNLIRHNFIRDVKTHFDGYGVNGVYLDDCVSGIRVEGNVIYRVSGHGILHGGGRDVIMVNNIIARGGGGISADSRENSPKDSPGDSWNLLEKLQKVGYRDEPWLSRYPECAAIPNDWQAIKASGALWLYPEGSVFSRNLGFDNHGWTQGTPATFDIFAEIVDNVENVDPKFVDEANLDLSLEANSPAYDIPGFQPIPFHDIGIKP